MGLSDKNKRLTGASSLMLVGVGGWLLFLCVSLSILSPLINLICLMISVYSYYPYLGDFPELRNFVAINDLLILALMVLSIRAGISLWRIHPKALLFARVFLFIIIGHATISYVLPFILLGTKTGNDMSGESTRSLIFGVVYATIWLQYLKRSKRVHNIYQQ